MPARFGISSTSEIIIMSSDFASFKPREMKFLCPLSLLPALNIYLLVISDCVSLFSNLKRSDGY